MKKSPSCGCGCCVLPPYHAALLAALPMAVLPGVTALPATPVGLARCPAAGRLGEGLDAGLPYVLLQKPVWLLLAAALFRLLPLLAVKLPPLAATAALLTAYCCALSLLMPVSVMFRVSRHKATRTRTSHVKRSGVTWLLHTWACNTEHHCCVAGNIGPATTGPITGML